MDKNTRHWIAHNSPMKKKHPTNISVVAWVHSHVQGVRCFFTGTDVHTQFTWTKFYPDILGLVVELDRDGVMKSYDYFGLTRQGKRNVEKCRNPGNECGNCSKNSNYSSCVHLINEFKGPLEIHDFTLAEPDVPMEIEGPSKR